MSKSVKKILLLLLFLSLLFLTIIIVLKFVPKDKGFSKTELHFDDYPYTLTVFDVGQGDAFLLRVYHKNILIDGGRRSGDVVSHLKEHQVDTLHWVIASHPHADHIGGLIPVFRNFPVINYMDNNVAHSSQTYHTYRFVADSAAITYTIGYKGWQYSFSENAGMEVLHPFSGYAEGPNNTSLVIRFQLGQNSVLFTGDIENHAELTILQSYSSIKSDILKVAHHGSSTSTCEEFLEALDPSLAFISCGIGNRYGHPSTLITQRLESAGINYYRTDQHGTVTVLFCGEAFIVEPAQKASGGSDAR